MLPLLKIDNMTVSFGKGTPDEHKVFENFNFAVEEGEFVSIVGSNGSGKTTLLNLISGTLRPDSGKILFKEKDISKQKEYQRARYIGRVFQDPQKGSCADLTILENMALADSKNRPFGLTPAVSKKRISHYQELLSECSMGLENRLNAKVGTLSGGQRQALALIIANMTDIDLLLLDEHTAALDPKSSQTVMELTEKLIREKQITTLMVTHNLRFAVEYGSRLVMLHEGKCIRDICGEEKKNTDIDTLLEVFNDISIECGN